jgi:hypothetical protein
MAVFLPEIYLLSSFKDLHHAHPHKELTSFVKNDQPITSRKVSHSRVILYKIYFAY